MVKVVVVGVFGLDVEVFEDKFDVFLVLYQESVGLIDNDEFD